VFTKNKKYKSGQNQGVPEMREAIRVQVKESKVLFKEMHRVSKI
jgi:hypothetical protein